MSGNYSTLTSIINAKFKVCNLDVLEEPNVMNIKVKGFPKDTQVTLYRFDPNIDEIFPFFERGIGLRLICDYILLVDYDGVLYVLLIELKKGKDSAEKQLNATEELILYIIASALRIKREIDKSKICIRKIRISERRSRYTKTTAVAKIEYDANKYVNYSWDTLHIRALLK